MHASSPPQFLPPGAYRGRFAPSPTGPLHAGSLVAALASWLDARAHGGTWLVRIDDLDPPREVPGAAEDILATLARFGMISDEPVVRQGDRGALYADALRKLQQHESAYGCACTRAEVDQAALAAGRPNGVYPGTCRSGLHGGRLRAWRFRVPQQTIAFVDRAVGPYGQQLEREVGDFVVRRADGLWAYQLAVVVDDAAQGITDIVRGADLLDNTPRQIALQQALGLPMPRYLHVPVVFNERGEKLSKQSGARALDVADTGGELKRALQHLGLLRVGGSSLDALLASATDAWAERWCDRAAGAKR